MILTLYSIINKTHLIVIGIIGTISLFLLGRNSRLSKQNKALNVEVQAQERLITIQNKVIDVVQNTPAVDIDVNIERMHDGKL